MSLVARAGVRVFCRRPAALPALRRLSSISNLVEQDDALSQITAHDKYGFKVNGVHLRGSVIVFRTFSLLWNVQRIVDVAPRNAAVVHMLEPRVDLFILGTGERLVDVNPSLYGYFSRKGICVEPMSTMHAIAQFNSLVLEGRRVAVGLISRSPMSRDDACLYAHGGAVQTEADRRLETALANDTATVTAAAAAAAPLQLPEGGGGSGVAALSALSLRRSVREAGALERRRQQELQLQGTQPPAAASAAAPSRQAPAPQVYGVEVPVAASAQPLQPQAPLDERTLAAQERRRVAQRPETGEDMMDALAQRSQRRSAVARRNGSGDDGDK